jgi:mRNA-degrading endonuclease RelE of RelBE toxin-antitoxin system
MVRVVERTQRFAKQYKRLDPIIQQRFKKSLAQFCENESHQSLRVRKMVNVKNVWEVRIDKHFRFTFSRIEDVIILRAIGTHQIYKNP